MAFNCLIYACTDQGYEDRKEKRENKIISKIVPKGPCRMARLTKMLPRVMESGLVPRFLSMMNRELIWHTIPRKQQPNSLMQWYSWSEQIYARGRKTVLALKA